VSKVARLDLTEWVSVDAALAQIKARVGSAELAVRDLHRDLRGGDLVGASRRIDYNPEQESCEVHNRSFWHDLEVRQADGHVRVQPSSYDPHHILSRGRVWFYVRRAELDRRYPHALEKPAKQGSLTQDLLKEIAAELWPSGYERVETKELIKEVGDELERRDIAPPKRDVYLRAFGRRKG
jgi:hypothetical protein